MSNRYSYLIHLELWSKDEESGELEELRSNIYADGERPLDEKGVEALKNNIREHFKQPDMRVNFINIMPLAVTEEAESVQSN